MDFNICHIGNEQWFNYKSDIIYSMLNSISECGYECSLTHNQLVNNRHNILIGADMAIEMGLSGKIKKTNVTYSILELEQIRNSTINKRQHFKFEEYVDFLSHAVCVFVIHKSNLDELSNYGISNARYFKWGYSSVLESNFTPQKSQYDFSFIGMAKGQRKEKLQKIIQDGFSIKVTDQNSPYMMKSYDMSASRFGLDLCWENDDDIFNYFRVCQYAAFGLPVLTDRKADPDSYTDDLYRISSYGDFDLDEVSEAVSDQVEITKSKLLTKNLSVVLD